MSSHADHGCAPASWDSRSVQCVCRHVAMVGFVEHGEKSRQCVSSALPAGHDGSRVNGHSAEVNHHCQFAQPGLSRRRTGTVSG
jgi:hypothetical protein